MLFMKDYIRYTQLATEINANLVARGNEDAIYAERHPAVLARARREFGTRLSESDYFWRYLTRVMEESLFKVVNEHMEVQNSYEVPLSRIADQLKTGKANPARMMPHAMKGRYKKLCVSFEDGQLRGYLIKDKETGNVYGEILEVDQELDDRFIRILDI